MATGSGNPFPQENRAKPSNDLTGVWPVYNQPSVFDWSGVDGGLMRAALHVTTVRGVTLAFGTAMGGRGVVLTLYMGGKTNPKRFALTPDELHELLYGIVAQWGSPSEDLGLIFGYSSTGHLAAD